MWQQLTDPGAVLTILVEFKHRTRQWKFLLISRHTCKPLSHSYRCRQVFTKHFIQLWFVVKQVQLRGCTILEQINNSFCFWRKMRKASHSQLFFTSNTKKIGDQ